MTTWLLKDVSKKADSSTDIWVLLRCPNSMLCPIGLYIFQERKPWFCPISQNFLPITTLKGICQHCREETDEVVVESWPRKLQLLAMLLTFVCGEGTTVVLDWKSWLSDLSYMQGGLMGFFTLLFWVLVVSSYDTWDTHTYTCGNCRPLDYFLS